MNQTELFERIEQYPDPEFQDRLNALVGLDDYKSKLKKVLGLLINSKGLTQWIEKYHKDSSMVTNLIVKRPPLIVFEGDVGAGKTELAMTIGDAVARQEDIDIMLYPLSLSTRGQGHVGEMTKLVSAAFDKIIQEGEKLKNKSGNSSRGGIILLIDEADALAQSRENSQMHHEDKAGVNAFIRGIDRIANGKLPVAVIMCTNRLSALDPAIKRRAADIFKFGRPNSEQRFAVLEQPLKELSVSDLGIKEIIDLTGENDKYTYGFTFSDLMQRLLPSIVMDVYPKEAVTDKSAIESTKKIIPTPPFKEKNE